MIETFTPDPERFAWHVDGVFVSGTLQSYAEQWKSRYYSGVTDEMGSIVVYWPTADATPIKLPVSVTRLHTDDNDDIHYYLSVPGGRNMIGGQVAFTVDGRA